jgi:hypothetical protein
MAITLPLLINRMGYISSVAIKWSSHTSLLGESCWELLQSKSDHLSFCPEVQVSSFSLFNALHITEHESCPSYFSTQCQQMFMNTSWLLAFMKHTQTPITVLNNDQPLP